MQYIHDPIHGVVCIPERQYKIICTPIFQRLRRIKQLGCLDVVWPSAVHTRYEHSIGTMHLALKYSQILNFNSETEYIFSVACLLHDIAHGPFSHVFEDIIVGTVSEQLFMHDHDNYRYYLIETDKKLKESLGEYIKDIQSVWRGKKISNDCKLSAHIYPILNSLLAGVAGVDRMDYILRDSYHLTPGKRIDPSCVAMIMLNTEVNIDNDIGISDITYNEIATKSVKIFLDEREYLYTNVYCHPRSIAASECLKKAFDKSCETYIRTTLQHCFERLDDGFIYQAAWNTHLNEDSRNHLLQFVRNEFPDYSRVTIPDKDSVCVNFTHCSAKDIKNITFITSRLWDLDCQTRMYFSLN